jgi:hypothetical protein
VSYLPPPQCPVSWPGSFQTRLPVSAPTIAACLAQPSFNMTAASGSWQPYLEAAPAPLVATLQYRTTATKMGTQLPPRVLRKMAKLVEAETPALWPPAGRFVLELMPSVPCLLVHTVTDPEKGEDVEAAPI